MRKPAKQPSFGRRLLRFFFSTASSLALSVGNLILRNPVIAGGTTAFAVVMGFVSANALWYQPQAHDTVFIQTRSDFTFKATPRPVLPGTIASQQEQPQQIESVIKAAALSGAGADEGQTSETAQISAERLQLSDVSDEMLPALAPNADIEVARLQQSLTAIGIYKGAVDGFTGPQTREAVEKWQRLQAKLGVPQKPISASENKVAPVVVSDDDEVAKLLNREVPVPQPHPNSPISRRVSASKPQTGVASIPSDVEKPAPQANVRAQPQPEKQPVAMKVTSQDIVRVQAGLKAFGNDRISVDGVPGKSTHDAVREFQKLFNLPVSGEIDAALIGKMREIGLIS